VIAAAVPYDQFRTLWEARYQEAVHCDRLKTKPGAKTLLAHIAQLGLPTALATSSSRGKACAKLERTNLLHYFSVIVGGDQVTNSKPDPEIYLTAAQKLNVNPRACLALEDSENGVKAAHTANMTVIQVPDLVPPSFALRQLGRRIIECLSHVPHIKFNAGLG
jgi:HAD superfamily hydrolase (TIGR01509 family)